MLQASVYQQLFFKSLSGFTFAWFWRPPDAEIGGPIC